MSDKIIQRMQVFSSNIPCDNLRAVVAIFKNRQHLKHALYSYQYCCVELLSNVYFYAIYELLVCHNWALLTLWSRLQIILFGPNMCAPKPFAPVSQLIKEALYSAVVCLSTVVSKHEGIRMSSPDTIRTVLQKSELFSRAI